MSDIKDWLDKDDDDNDEAQDDLDELYDENEEIEISDADNPQDQEVLREELDGDVNKDGNFELTGYLGTKKRQTFLLQNSLHLLVGKEDVILSQQELAV